MKVRVRIIGVFKVTSEFEVEADTLGMARDRAREHFWGDVNAHLATSGAETIVPVATEVEVIKTDYVVSNN